MKHFITCMLLIIAMHVSAQKPEVLNNKSIVDLTAAGMSKQIIISKIQSSPCKFTTDTKSLIALKKSNVDQDVISEMMNKTTATDATVTTATATAAPAKSSTGTTTGTSSGSTTTAATTTNAPVTATGAVAALKKNGSGIYYEQPSDKEIIELDPTVFSQEKKNNWNEMWSYGFAKSKKVMSVSGGKANLQFKTTRPVFYFYFDPENKSLNTQAPTWFASVSSPNEFLIIKFNTKVKNSRAVTTASSNAYESAAGIDDEFKRTFKFKKLEKGIYEVYFETDLEPGEYGFMYAGATATNGGGSPKVYDFGVSQ